MHLAIKYYITQMYLLHREASLETQVINYVRVSLCTTIEKIEEAIKRIQNTAT